MTGGRTEDWNDDIRCSEHLVSCYRLLDRLDVNQRMAFCLVVIHRMGPGEAATTLGVTPSVVKDWLAAAYVRFDRLARSSFSLWLQQHTNHGILGAKIAGEQDRLLGDRRIYESDLPPRGGRKWLRLCLEIERIVRERTLSWLLAMMVGALVGALIGAAIQLRNGGLPYWIAAMLSSGCNWEGQWVSAPLQQPRVVSLGIGSRIELAPGSRLRVLSRGGHRNSAVLEAGAMTISMSDRDRIESIVVAGPFGFNLDNGRARLSWDPNSEMLDVSVHGGAVTLSGCQFGSRKAVLSGESLRARCLVQE